MTIKGRNVIIRGIERNDLNLMVDLLNNETIEEMTEGFHFPISKAQEDIWFDNYIKSGDVTRFIIETPANGSIGMVDFGKIDWINRRFNLGIKVLEKKNNTLSVGVDAVMAMLRYGFDGLNMHRVDCATLEYNKASLAMQKLCGFQEEGRRRSSIFRNGKYWDQILTSILKEEYYAFIEKEHYWD